MRDESDDSCARCGRRGRDFGYAEPAAWILDTARWQCRLCACVAACGGWREALLELQRGALHTKGGTPAGSRVTLRELSRAACVREVEAFERGERLPLGPAGSIVSSTPSSAGASYRVRLDSSGEVVSCHAAGVRREGQLLDLPMN